MAGDPVRWHVARLAAGGERTLSPSGPGPGRNAALRTLWLVRVRAVLDAVARLRGYALVAAHWNPKKACEYVRQADQLEATGAAGGGVKDDQAAIGDWEKLTGGSMADPAFRDKVYRAVAEVRRREAEEAGKLAEARKRAARRPGNKPAARRAGGTK